MNEKIENAIKVIQTCYNEYYNGTILTTSGGITSALMIDLISKSKCNIPIVMIDTGFLFPQTLEHFEHLKSLYPRLLFLRLVSNLENKLHANDARLVTETDLDKCCFENKTSLIKDFIIINKFKCWITALRKDQNEYRANIEDFIIKKQGACKAYPVLDWTKRDVMDYLRKNNLPLNPLYYEGYDSIGCEPCTNKGKNREGRWFGKEKTECGMHLESVEADHPIATKSMLKGERMEHDFGKNFCFKGGRTYVHGTDIFNELMNHYPESAKRIDLTFHSVITRNMIFTAAKPDIGLVNIVFKCQLEDKSVKIYGIESDDEVDCRYEYDEEKIVEKSYLDLESKIITLKELPEYSFIENIVAMNKALVSKLYHDVQGKWYFTRLQLDENISMDHVKSLSIQLLSNFQLKLTKSSIMVNENQVGYIYFSLYQE